MIAAQAAKRAAQEEADKAAADAAQAEFNKILIEDKLSHKDAADSGSTLLAKETKKTLHEPISAKDYRRWEENGEVISEKALYDGFVDNVKSKKTGRCIEQHCYSNNENLYRSALIKDPNHYTIINYEGFDKGIPNHKTVYGYAGDYETVKNYCRNDKGKFVCTKRTKEGNGIEKIVEQHKDHSVTKIFDDNKEIKQEIIRDKKGKILSDVVEALYDDYSCPSPLHACVRAW